MNLMPLKQRYWQLCNRLQRWRNPPQTVLTPEDPLAAMQRLLAPCGERIVMVDGGAHDGVVARDFANRLTGLEVHAFEPNTDLLPQLEANLADIPGGVYCSAISADTGEAKMHINASPMTGSLLPAGDFGRKYFADVMVHKEMRTIPMTRLDDWANENGIHQIDLLKLDLQGYEIEAMKGATGLLRRGVRVIYTEINFVPFYEGAALFGELDAFMRSHGYRLYNYYHLATRHEDGQLGGGDAIYIPDESHAIHQTQAAAPACKEAA